MNNTRIMQVIVVNNIKGGCGKTTTCVNLSSALLHVGYNVATLDLDINQFSLTRFFENRRNRCPDYDQPQHFVLHVKPNQDVYTDQQEYFMQQVMTIFANLKHESPDFLVIDTPAGDTFIADLVLNYADIIITPVNESMIDLDLIVRKGKRQFMPGLYSQKIWQKKMQIAEKFKKQVSWYILKNRIAPMRSNASNQICDILAEAQQKFGFRILDGFHERVIFKELFDHGITLLDLIKYKKIRLTPSHLAAKQELRNFVKIILQERVLQN